MDLGEVRRRLEAAGFEVEETHISLVFLGREEVFKVKKPVDLGFLDFTSEERRLEACRAEVRLNRRLAPEVYLGVVPLVLTDRGELRFGGEGERVDWAVHMRRLPHPRRADVLLADGALVHRDLEAVAEVVARFHAEARSDEETARLGGPEVLRRNVRENFEQTADTIGQYLSPSQVAEVEEWQLQFLDTASELLARRVEEGRIRDGHGDLRLEHVYLLERPPGAAAESCLEGRDDADPPVVRIVDCIEFNDRFRYADVCADVAFLAMDLAFRERVDLAESFLARYAQRSDDWELYSLVDFYESYRAFVRAKVTSLLADAESTEPGLRERAREETRRYFLLSLASERRRLVEPVVVVVGGIIASGKSTVARALARRLAAPVIASDPTRKHLLGKGEEEPVHDPAFAGGYSPSMTEKVYEELLRRAERVVHSGRSVVLDASFRERRFRERARQLAERLGVDFLFVECRAPERVCRERLQERAKERGVSDGRLEIFDDFVRRWEPVEEIAPGRHLELDTTRTLEENLERLQARLPVWR